MRLEPEAKDTETRQRYHFNSIKVRLELPACRKVARTQQFQFHKGAIRTAFGKKYVDLYNDFNSIKVRLEHPKDVELKEIDIFQFHKGAIRTRKSDFQARILQHFNSIKVRLEHHPSQRHDRDTQISIP